ncbi:MAG: cyclic nucleotide-binding domain-containing protein [Candidatus Dadabacteria bacterium]|nr:cyclic nucleotide-binding domain-containing protein [Candidatus Dadabacteria bacterium]
MQKLKTVLSKNQLFKGLDKRYLQLIVDCASDVHFNSGDIIFHEGEEANQFHIIREGRVALEVVLASGREPIIIQVIGEGDILGWSWLFPPYRRHFDARAVTNTKAIAIDGKYLRTKCEKDHHLGYELMKRFTILIEKRLRGMRLQNPDMYAIHA